MLYLSNVVTNNTFVCFISSIILNEICARCKMTIKSNLIVFPTLQACLIVLSFLFFHFSALKRFPYLIVSPVKSFGCSVWWWIVGKHIKRVWFQTKRWKYMSLINDSHCFPSKYYQSFIFTVQLVWHQFTSKGRLQSSLALMLLLSMVKHIFL